MNIIKEIIQNIDNLDGYIDNNSTKILDFFQEDYRTLMTYRNEIEAFISLNSIALKHLDKTKYSDFILLLLETTERLGLEPEFQILFNILKEYNIKISNRLIATSLFYNSRNATEYLSIYDKLIEYLKKGYELEEDNEEKIIFTFLNYFSQALSYYGEYNHKVIEDIKLKLSKSLKSEQFPFLNNSFIKSILDLDIKDYKRAISKVKEITDNILGINYLKNIELYSTSEHLIETNTKYSDGLPKIKTNFLSIREYNKIIFSKLRNQDELYRELRKGVHILETSEHLITYMYSYGKMHYYKLIDAFNHLPYDFYKNEIEIIDWACGQGLASMVYLTHLNEKKVQQEIDTFTLIEPSLIALKRAALHIKHIKKDSKIITINKDFNELLKLSLKNNTQNLKLHLFSNILDIETFSIKKLTEFIKNNFKGKNYFVIVSPLIPNARKLRINDFVNHFRNISSFKLLCEIDKYSGEWLNNWSKMIRIFEVKIE